MPFPDIDPVIFQIGPFALRWYALAYIAGLLLGWRYVVLLARRTTIWPKQAPASEVQIDDLLLWVTLGVVLGGRLGYVSFYNTVYYAANPSDIIAVWQGGMSFHGGLLGVVVAVILYARRHAIALFSLGDMIAAAVPIGLFFGRLANFINSELWGRTTNVAWGVIFPNGGPLPRHPSQLYEAALEGLFLFALLSFMVWRKQALARPGLVTGVFLSGYGLARILVELVREPDAHLGFVSFGLTMGQILSLPMLMVGWSSLAPGAAR
ncbi:MAG: prolipoprotein diacylglyceryl transferase [Alphaproteobacteria bacterium]|nr:prolipoprotein diacylglyceryl transferase [Alphaproteobacteria bacterium]